MNKKTVYNALIEWHKNEDSKFIKDGKAMYGTYSTLDNLLPILHKSLAKYDLGISFIIEPKDEKVFIKCILMHSKEDNDNNYIESSIPLPSRYTELEIPVKNPLHAMGSIITYYKRYLLMAILGISGEDDDGNSNEVFVKKDSYNQIIEYYNHLLDEAKAFLSQDHLNKFTPNNNWVESNYKKGADFLKKLLEEKKK